jgi:hypothetical protein
MFQAESSSLRFWLISTVAVTLCFGSLTAVWGNGALHGHARFEKVKGRPDLGYLELYEYKAFISMDGNTSNCFGYHCGDPGTALHPGTGCYWFPSVPAGTYSILTSFGKFFPRGKLTSSVTVINNQTTERNSDEPIDFAAYYTKGEWDPSGANPVFQTFVATGNSIIRASFAKADSNSGGQVEFSIHEDNGGAVETWPQVGPKRSVGRGGYGADHWVAWQAGELPATPGKTYALRLYDPSGVNIQPYWCNDSFYPQGRGYRWNEENPANHDYYVAIFSDNDDTIGTITIRNSNLGNLEANKSEWAQSYTARGTSFGGVCLLAFTGVRIDTTVTVHQGTPNGPQVGPAKRLPQSVPPQGGIDVVGISFSRGEVPTVPGQVYWVVFDGAGGIAPYRQPEGNPYPDGTAAFWDGTWLTRNFDLYLDLSEFASGEIPPTPTPTPTPAPGENMLTNPGFESSFETNHPGWINNLSFYTNNNFPMPPGSVAYEGEQWAGYSHGGAIVQELYQTVPVTPGHTYFLSTQCNAGGTGSTATGRLMWADGEYPGVGNGTLLGSLTWESPDGPTPWNELSGYAIPTGSSLTFILQAEIGGWSGGVNFDACSAIDQTVEDTPTPTPPPFPHLLTY